MLRRLEILTIEIISNYQCNFTKNKLTIDHMCVRRQIMETFYEFNKDLHMLFFDFKQAFDHINREHFCAILMNLEFP